MTALQASIKGAQATQLQVDIEELARLDLHQLRQRWRKLTRTVPPDRLPKPLLLRLLAYKLQAKTLGDLDTETARYLARVERERVRRRSAVHKRSSKAPPPVPPVPAPRGLKPGTLLVREHAGQMHTVTVTSDGFSWQGTPYKSLSEIARLITGTRWNGPRFFGLREGSTPAGAAAGGDRS